MAEYNKFQIDEAKRASNQSLNGLESKATIGKSTNGELDYYEKMDKRNRIGVGIFIGIVVILFILLLTWVF